jgi:Uncharacterised protein family (UPF0203)
VQTVRATPQKVHEAGEHVAITPLLACINSAALILLSSSRSNCLAKNWLFMPSNSFPLTSYIILIEHQWYKNRFLQGDVGGAETCHSLLLDWKECVSIAVEDHEAAERVAVKQATTSSAEDKKGS